jgi:hypothetical protein
MNVRSQDDDKGRKGLAGKDPIKKLIDDCGSADKAIRVLFQSDSRRHHRHCMASRCPTCTWIAAVAKDLLQPRLARRRSPHGGRARTGPECRSTRRSNDDVVGEAVRVHAQLGRVRRRAERYITEKLSRTPSSYRSRQLGRWQAVNVYSRVQMMLFKARTFARTEFDAACKENGVTAEEVRAFVAKHPLLSSPFFQPDHYVTHTAADVVHHVAPLMKDGMVKGTLRSLVRRFRGHTAHASHAAAATAN